MNALEPLLPVLQTLEPLGLPAGSLQGWYAYANQKQAARLAQHLKEEFGVILRTFPAQVDHAYLRSDAFEANVVQAVRAAEVAESEDKLRFIARALASCTLSYVTPTIDRFQTLRLIEAVSDRELRVFVEYFRGLDPIDPFSGFLLVSTPFTVTGLSRQEASAALLGLEQLGLLAKEQVPSQDDWAHPPDLAWTLTALARQVAVLGRLTGHEDGPDLYESGPF
ncbi:hypothetical protein DEDE109153_17250 [Deinococcus deserti]|uniref:Uncharacterized protein n=1 Tax=Deinococcus deserti (strain DSM 17065 / CIP 109153 / LMG 22923 / VCD115) TaxID=546414 RepID=C1CZA0_DEIDV|nr:hypothetical protein [Deinococcus deserti]ACO45138.1 Hypothetical protein Deide_03180 [Deinococcus deserti VCD115]